MHVGAFAAKVAVVSHMELLALFCSVKHSLVHTRRATNYDRITRILIVIAKVVTTCMVIACMIIACDATLIEVVRELAPQAKSTSTN
jgi:hypothetical protein